MYEEESSIHVKLQVVDTETSVVIATRSVRLTQVQDAGSLYRTLLPPRMSVILHGEARPFGGTAVDGDFVRTSGLDYSRQFYLGAEYLLSERIFLSVGVSTGESLPSFRRDATSPGPITSITQSVYHRLIGISVAPELHLGGGLRSKLFSDFLSGVVAASLGIARIPVRTYYIEYGEDPTAVGDPVERFSTKWVPSADIEAAVDLNITGNFGVRLAGSIYAGYFAFSDDDLPEPAGIRSLFVDPRVGGGIVVRF